MKNNESLSKKSISLLYSVSCIIAIVIMLIQPVQLLHQNRDKFFGSGYTKQFEELKEAYYSSQYVKKSSPGIIPDEVFESFAGGAFLRGLNPILIVHDHPPMGRYIVSLSIFLFDNANTIIVPLLVLAAVGIFLIARLILKNLLISLIIIGIFINEPLFLNKFMYSPLPESIHLPFIVFAIYFFIKSVNTKHYLPWFVLTSMMLGFVISIRFFVLGAALTSAMVLFLFLRQREKIRILSFLFTLPIAGVILLLSYTRTMMTGYSVIQIIGIQKYILSYHQSKFILPLTYWDLLLFNRWHTWWGEKLILSDSNWVIMWPVAVVSTIISGILGFLRKISITNEELLLFLWVGIYSIVLSTGYTSTRYFLSVIPFFYILAASLYQKMWVRYFGDKRG